MGYTPCATRNRVEYEQFTSAIEMLVLNPSTPRADVRAAAEAIQQRLDDAKRNYYDTNLPVQLYLLLAICTEIVDPTDPGTAEKARRLRKNASDEPMCISQTLLAYRTVRTVALHERIMKGQNEYQELQAIDPLTGDALQPRISATTGPRWRRGRGRR